jgi:hypothetical protein
MPRLDLFSHRYVYVYVLSMYESAIYILSVVLGRYGADELVTHFTIEAAEIRAWARPSVDGLPLPLGLTGAHVFHVWLGLGRVHEVFEVRGLWDRLKDRISRIHVRRILAVMRMRPNAPSCRDIRRLSRCQPPDRSPFPKRTRSLFAVRRYGAHLLFREPI